jgi:hypothetical protein
MIAMKVAHKYAIDAGRSDIGKNELPLRALAWIEKKPLLIPPKKIGAMVPAARGLLAGTS